MFEVLGFAFKTAFFFAVSLTLGFFIGILLWALYGLGDQLAKYGFGFFKDFNKMYGEIEQEIRAKNTVQGQPGQPQGLLNVMSNGEKFGAGLLGGWWLSKKLAGKTHGDRIDKLEKENKELKKRVDPNLF
jgi:hypothetical protein